MKIVVTEKGKAAKEATSAQNKRRGRTSRNKGSSYERDIAAKFKNVLVFDLVRTPQSGGFAKKCVKASEFRGDIVPADDSIIFDLHVECKNAKTWSMPKWIEQAEGDCPKGKKPVVIFHKHGTSRDYIALRLEDFFALCDKAKIVRKKKG